MDDTGFVAIVLRPDVVLSGLFRMEFCCALEQAHRVLTRARMRDAAKTPSFKGLRPASEKASRAAQGASAKANTRCEVLLRRELWRRGLRYRLSPRGLPGRPDIVFLKERVAIFCDGDFWHGRDLPARLAKLSRGHNARYWVAKVQRNVDRDRRQTQALEAAGWTVLRFWETDILRDVVKIAENAAGILAPSEPSQRQN